MRATVRIEDLPPDVQRKLRAGNVKAASQKEKYEAAVKDLKLRLRALGLPQPVREYVFASPRRWRFDFAWVEEKLALECDGGIWVAGRHSRGSGILKEHEKKNAAAKLGWRILYCIPKNINAPELVEVLESALQNANPGNKT